MASTPNTTNIIVAKASFAAALLRPDPTSIHREETSRFQKSLDDTVLQCTPANIQKSKGWISTNVLPSNARITALGKYLAALSASLGQKSTQSSSTTGFAPLPRAGPSVRRRRLHIVYLLNDLFHHAKYHADTPARLAPLAANLQTQLVSIVTLTASFESSKWPKHHKKVNDVLDIWSRNGYLSKEHLDDLRKAVKVAATTGSAGSTGTLDVPKEVPYTMPATHGNLNTPWYDLPAANMIPHIIPNSNVPINPALIRPLQLVAGPAKESLVNVVKDFLKDVEAMYDKRTAKDDTRIVDLDQMGQPLVRNEATGALVPLEAYYGWSIGFCTKMKKKKKRGGLDEDERDIRGRSRSPVHDNEASNRRRYSSSRSPSRTRHQGFRDRSYSRSPNRSRSPYRRSSPPVISNAPPQLTMPPLNRHLSSLTNSFSRPPLSTPIDQIDNPMATIQPPPPVQSGANHYQHNFPLGPSGLPIPPPPPFHTGPWPPPPPALPSGMNYNPGQYPNFSTMTFVPPPPPALPTSMGAGYVGQTLGLGGARVNQIPGAQSGIWQDPPQPPPQMGYVAAMLQGQGQGQGQQGSGYGGQGQGQQGSGYGGQGQGQQGSGYEGQGRGDRGQGLDYRGQGQGRGGHVRGRGGWRGGGDSRRY